MHGDPTVELHAFLDRKKKVAPGMPVLVVDVPKNGDLIAEYLMDGASGCLAVEHGLDELINALETMQEDCPYLPSSVQAALLQQFVTVRRQFIDAFGGIHSRDDLGLDELTDRERKCLPELVAQELTTGRSRNSCSSKWVPSRITCTAS
ncbi:MAG: hypothetical protein R2849_15230 [Thermomicrobiales bacterium]